MEFSGPTICEACERVEYYLTEVNEVTIQVFDPNNCTVYADIQSTDDPSRKKIIIVPDLVGRYIVTIYGKSKDNPLIQKELFCYNLKMELWKFNELHGSLDDVHILMETRLHRPILDKITSQAHLLIEDFNNDDHVALQCKVDSTLDMTCDFSFKPPQYGTYEILIFCEHKSINNPRPIIHVVDYSKFKLVHTFTTDRCIISLKKKVSFIFDLVGAPSSYLRASINCPDKKKVDMLLYGEEKAEKIGQLRCDFVPNNIGTHTLLACYGDMIFDKCPLTFQVYNASNVKVCNVTPLLTDVFYVNNTVTVTYDYSGCGPGLLDVSVIVNLSSGSSSSISTDKTVIKEQGLMKCRIKLSLPGKYTIDALYNNELIKELSLNLQVHPSTEESVAKKQSNIIEADNLTPLVKENGIEPSSTGPIVSGDGLLHAVTGKEAMFSVDPKEETGQLIIDVKGPKSLTKCLIRPEPESNCYNVEYYPNEIGLYTITILWNNKLINGSPFNVFVTDPSMIKCLNFPNIFDQTFYIIRNKKFQIDFDYSKAGNGNISAIIKKDDDQTMLKCSNNTAKKIASFVIESNSQSLYNVSVFWDDVIIGVIKVQCQSSIDSTDSGVYSTNNGVLQVILRGRGMKEAYVGELTEFIIDTLNAGHGNLDIKLSNTLDDTEEISVDVVHNANGEYRCRYTPNQSGEYLLAICWGKKTVKGSPFPVIICDKRELAHELSMCYGKCYGFVGEETYINLNTDCMVENENLFEISCIDEQNNSIVCHMMKKDSTQYQVKVVANSRGEYKLSVFYDKIHIYGSPFQLTIRDRQSFGNINVYGPGLLSGLLNIFDSQFTVDTSGAGTGRITVQVKGPQESFRVQIQRDTVNKRLIQCSYNPMSTGEYVISVLWNDLLSRGSPFHISLT